MIYSCCIICICSSIYIYICLYWINDNFYIAGWL